MHILGVSRAFGSRRILNRQGTFDDGPAITTRGTLSETTADVDRLIMLELSKLQQAAISAKPTGDLCYTWGGEGWGPIARVCK